MQKLFQSLLLGSAIALTGFTVQAADRGLGVDVSIGGKKGINAGVDATLGSRKGVDAGVDVSVGGRKGVNADVDVSVGGKKGVNVDVDAGLGDDVNADAKVSLGGTDVNVDIGLGTDDDVATTPGVDPGTDPDGGSLTSAQRQAFNRMSDRDKKALLTRCNTISAGSYDSALVKLCALLRMSASR